MHDDKSLRLRSRTERNQGPPLLIQQLRISFVGGVRNPHPFWPLQKKAYLDAIRKDQDFQLLPSLRISGIRKKDCSLFYWAKLSFHIMASYAVVYFFFGVVLGAANPTTV